MTTIDRITLSLAARFPDVPVHVVRHSVERNHRFFDNCPIRAYLAILTERAARTELQATARTLRGAP